MLLLILKVNEVKGEIPNSANLATTPALYNVENETPNVSNLVKKTDYKKIKKKKKNWKELQDNWKENYGPYNHHKQKFLV